MQTNTLEIVLTEKNIAKENAAMLLEAYGAPFTEAGVILANYQSIIVTDETQTDLMKEAGEKRKALKKIRTGVEDKRKKLKESINVQAQAIDGVARYIKDTIQPAEEYLELQEKFAEVKAAERAAKLKTDRIEQLSQYTDNLSIYSFDDMNQLTFDALLKELKDAYEARLARAEADRLEALRLEKERAAEQERIRLENEKLRAEAEAAEIQRAIERKAEANKQAEAQAIADKKLSEANAAAQAEREKREKAEAEQRAQEAAVAKEKADVAAEEAKLKADQDAAELAALLAPDKDKLLSFSHALEMIRTQKLPAVKTKQAQDVVQLIDEMLVKMQTIIKTKAKDL